MQNNEIDLLQLTKSVWRKRKKIATYAIIGAIVGVIIAISLPREYTSSMLVVSENKNSSQSGGMGALASMVGANLNLASDASINDKIYPYILKSTPFISEFVDIPVEHKGEIITFSDYLLNNQKSPWWSYIISAPKKLMTSIFSDRDSENINILENPKLFNLYTNVFKSTVSLEVDEKDKVISISTTTQSPVISKQINDSIYVKLKSYLYDYKTAKARHNLERSVKSMEEAKDIYYKTHEEYAQAQDKNKSLIQESARVKLKRLENENDIAFNTYQQLATQVELDKIKLQEETPIATIIQPSLVSTIPSSISRVTVVIISMILGVMTGIVVVLLKDYK